MSFQQLYYVVKKNANKYICRIFKIKLIVDYKLDMQEYVGG